MVAGSDRPDTYSCTPAGCIAEGTLVVLLGEFPASTSWADARAALDAAAAAVVA
jgi:hypothetical protein